MLREKETKNSKFSAWQTSYCWACFRNWHTHTF